MAKVTKTAAHQVAETMANNAVDPKIKELNNLVSKILTDYAVKIIPKEIMVLFENPKTKNYFESRNSVRFTCDGLSENWNTFRLLKSIPSKGNNLIEVSKKDYELLIETTKEIKVLESKKYNLEKNIEETLLSLSTLKRVQDEFSEAYELLEPIIGEKKTTAISLPISELINELKSYT